MPTMEQMRARFSLDKDMFSEDVLQYGSYGAIPGVPVGTSFASRKACSAAKVHTPLVPGISGSSIEGACSVVLSGGYEDDIDEGETFTYTGAGGRSQDEGAAHGSAVKQTEDQTFNHKMNLALKISSGANAHPVRVIRGSANKSVFAPPDGFRYDGLYKVEKAYMEKGKSGYMVCRFLFRRLPGQPRLPKRVER